MDPKWNTCETAKIPFKLNGEVIYSLGVRPSPLSCWRQVLVHFCTASVHIFFMLLEQSCKCDRLDPNLIRTGFQKKYARYRRSGVKNLQFFTFPEKQNEVENGRFT